jgi:hypothetical protein
MYFDCAAPAHFLTHPRRLIAYLVPYLPVTPTFFVLFVILADVAMMSGV